MKTTKRRANNGERILIVGTEMMNESRKGEIYTVESRLGGCVNVKEMPWAVLDCNYEVIESDETVN